MDKKTVVIHQPDFLPYLGFFDRLLKADLYVVLDDVQFVNNGKECWHRRDKIKTAQGEQWITVGVQKTPLGTKICDVLLNNNNNWRENNLNLLKENYKKAAFFAEIMPYMEKLYSYETDKLLDFNMQSINLLLDLLGISVDSVFASSIPTKGKSNELLVEILQSVKATDYLSGVGARSYYVPEFYSDAGINVLWQDFQHPVYPQLFGDFIPNLSSIDLLFNCGIEESRKILRGC